ncbi:MAG: SLC13 family permease [Ruminococcus sp.]
MKRFLQWWKGQPVLGISLLAALVSMCFVPPDAGYLSYCNRAVLIQLFCLMLTVAGLRSIGVFEQVTQNLLKRAGTVRRVGLFLVQLCFFSAMLVTNDVALLTFVPLTLLLFRDIGDEKSRIRVIVLETAAANLGSMMTPVGNPQNLYLYAAYQLHTGDFFRTMLLPAC